MTSIHRDPAAAAKKDYELLIIGGGVYGAMLSLEAARRSIPTLLLERDDFGARTSYNSLRIVHGGLRYLQSLDLHRFFESVQERRWFLQTFPHLLAIMPCLMPLYGQGTRSPSLFRLALLTNDMLSCRRNRTVPADKHLPGGKIISPEETRRIFPRVQAQGLRGGAVWYDVCMPDSPRILMEVLRWASSLGAAALNYVEAGTLLTENGAVCGVAATDRESGISHKYRAARVVNAAGPWSRMIAARFDRDDPPLFRPSIAWNVLFDRKSLSTHALAVSPGYQGARTYFLVPWKGKLLAGTGHEPAADRQKSPAPSPGQLLQFMGDLNKAVPGLSLSQEEIITVFSGYLPAAAEGDARLAVREVIVDHHARGGPQGLYSVSGVKFTTARLVAEKTIRRMFPGRRVRGAASPPACQNECDWSGLRAGQCRGEAQKALQTLIAEESVQHLDDLLFRRTGIGDDPRQAREIAGQLCAFFNWDRDRRELETGRVINRILKKRADGYERDVCKY